MAPAISAGDLILVREMSPSDAAVGDIVTFRDPSRADAIVTHRIVSVRRDRSIFRFVTKGDANGAEERWSIGAEATVGSYLARVPKAGYFLGWIGSAGARAGLLVAAAVILLSGGVRRLWERHKARTKGESKQSKKRLRRALVLMAVWSIGVVMGHFANFGTEAAFSDATPNSGNAFATAASFGSACSSPGTQTVIASSDTYLDQNDSDGNFGTETSLLVQAARDARDNKIQRSLVKFTLPSIPSGCSVTLAKLRLNASSAVTGRTLEVWRAAASWTEGGATWDNRPGLAGTAVTTTSGTGWREWTVTAHVQELYSGTNNGFVVRDAGETSGDRQQQVFRSRQSSTNRPELVITWG
jgi:signal peptidase I